ncbi:MAG: hypothetical protein IKV54_07490 [Clostridia bacterium]|nr:hypothetical protein [Clostridia bacterium]
MGSLLGSHDIENERTDLNKCPDCECFFAGDTCPMCGKPCPEEMRAGVRKPVKIKKHKGGSDRVTFVQWYHSWWFIIIMMLFMPIIGIILLATSPHKRLHKGIFIAVALLYAVMSFYGIGNVIGCVTSNFEKPVNTALSREDYIAKCTAIDAESYFRTGNSREGDFVSVELKIVDNATNYSKLSSKYPVYYLCTGPDGGNFRIIIRSCIREGDFNLIPGDVIRIYGEAAKTVSAYDSSYVTHTAPQINVAFADILSSGNK